MQYRAVLPPHTAAVNFKGLTQMANFTLTYRRNHPGGGPLGRCSYGLAGVPGIVVFDLGLFPGGVAPATITLDVALAMPTARKVAGVTSAVVATANLAVAQATTAPIAPPAVVAATVAAKAIEVVASKGRANRGHKAKVG